MATRREPSRILIVDDNEGDIVLLRKAFRFAKVACEVVAFTHGEDALRYVRETANSEGASKPDAALLDMHLPGFEDTTILEAVRNNRFLRNAPVIVLSSAISNEDRERIQPYNVARHVVKPSDLEEFLKIGEMVRDELNASGKTEGI